MIPFDPTSHNAPRSIDDHRMGRNDDGTLYIRPKTTWDVVFSYVVKVIPWFSPRNERGEVIRDVLATALANREAIESYSPAQCLKLYANVSYFSQRVIQRHNTSWMSKVCCCFWKAIDPLKAEALDFLNQRVKSALQTAHISCVNEKDKLEQFKEFLRDTRPLLAIPFPDPDIRKLWIDIDKVVFVKEWEPLQEKGLYAFSEMNIPEEWEDFEETDQGQGVHWFRHAKKLLDLFEQCDQQSIDHLEEALNTFKAIRTTDNPVAPLIKKLFERRLSFIRRTITFLKRLQNLQKSWAIHEPDRFDQIKTQIDHFATYIFKPESPLLKEIQTTYDSIILQNQTRKDLKVKAKETLTSARERLENDLGSWANKLDQRPQLKELSHYYRKEEFDELIENVQDVELTVLRKLFIDEYEAAKSTIAAMQRLQEASLQDDLISIASTGSWRHRPILEGYTTQITLKKENSEVRIQNSEG